MKKALLIIVALTLTISLSACSLSNKDSSAKDASSGTTASNQSLTSENAENKEIKTTAEDVLKYFKQNDAPDLGDYLVFDEETDPNKLLGRPGEYISKADFAITSFDITEEKPYCATIETFENEQDAIKRYDYIAGIYEEMPILKEYMYRNSTVIIRMNYDILPSVEKEYEKLLDKYIDSLI